MRTDPRSPDLVGPAVSAGKGGQPGAAPPGTTRAQARGVGTLTWAGRQPANRWAFTIGARARPEDLKQGPLVLAIFFVTQVLDGVLTYWGVTRFGIDIEMNSLLAATMHEVGPGLALFTAKAVACACGVLLYVNAYLRPLAAVAGLCLGLAVVPWIVVAAWLA
jgi:hypothetical protein